ncbi:hypothetical protein E3E12_08040 [Formicincola oecophyllae]|uniref:Uncharacterized protein n=1 Tax=Formicincola oecophyllae TaxID=2558361 RepID=A0A4Y6UCD3_9PROT|nr:hypothetical protein [Formicincola oecophyllae]QDH14146.1 hypothetical protein E3E12_08040 [Formicincola oecophyllae]
MSSHGAYLQGGAIALVLLAFLLCVSGCTATVPVPAPCASFPATIPYSPAEEAALAQELRQGTCGPHCTEWLADYTRLRATLKAAHQDP